MAAVGERADIAQKLNRRRSVPPLAESGRGHVVIRPLRFMLQLLDSEFELRAEGLVRGLIQLLLDLLDLPIVFFELRLPRRRGAGKFVRQVDPGALAKMEFADPILEFIHAELNAQAVKVPVT